jgi:hypothetical protein
MLYEVGVRWEQERTLVEAKNSTQAKRKYCKQTGRNYNDPWSGASILTARRVPRYPEQKGANLDVAD